MVIVMASMEWSSQLATLQGCSICQSGILIFVVSHSPGWPWTWDLPMVASCILAQSCAVFCFGCWSHGTVQLGAERDQSSVFLIFSAVDFSVHRGPSVCMRSVSMVSTHKYWEQFILTICTEQLKDFFSSLIFRQTIILYIISNQEMAYNMQEDRYIL